MNIRYKLFVRRVPYCARQACIGSPLIKFAQHIFITLWDTLYQVVLYSLLIMHKTNVLSYIQHTGVMVYF